MNDPSKSFPIVTSVFSLSIKQEEDLPFMDHPESETSVQVHSPETGCPSVRPDILIRFKDERFRTELQGSEKRGNLPEGDTYDEQYEAGEGFKTDSKRMRKCDGHWKEEWKHKDGSRDKPDLSANCEEGIGSITPTRVKEIVCKEERSVREDRNSNQCPKLVPTQRLKNDKRRFKSADIWENFNTDSHFLEHHIPRIRTEVHDHQNIIKTNPFGDCASHEKPFKCSECQKCFKKKAYLRQHKMTHMEEKLFKCSECDKWLKWKQSLQRHKIIHMEEKPFKCSECDKCFTQKGSLQLHNMTHTGERPFQCSQCDKCFRKKSDLQQHKMTHMGQKPFKYSECDKCFGWKNACDCIK
ncbi:zinc finger protein 493-like [Microcaecilia unicolor]|uniref:Zinc finger protein 493-like n=1 Tax=Microcaecilia unicolor TaxID=1415580 RepID=A0A6P7X591_9AMPH|nr:zinc finger protein 493-like [Microcaecilia unicolor]